MPFSKNSATQLNFASNVHRPKQIKCKYMHELTHLFSGDGFSKSGFVGRTLISTQYTGVAADGTNPRAGLYARKHD